MKIAYIVPSIVRSGPIRVVEQLVRGLGAEEEVDLFYLEERNDRPLIDFGDRAQKIRFSQAIDFDRYDIVHSHTIKADAYLWRHRNRIKRAGMISTVHNLAYEDLPMQYGPLKGKLLAEIWRRMLRSFDGVVALTAGALEYYRKAWPDVPFVAYVHNGIDRSDESPRKAERRIEKGHRAIRIGVLASAGGIGERKGVDQVIRALRILPGYELFVAGKETEAMERLKALSRAEGVEKRVHFVGFVDEVPRWIETMDVMAAPSRSEGFSLGLLEIVRAGKALVCSRIPSYLEAFDEREVFFFTPEDIEGLAAALRRAVREGPERAQRAYRRFLREYTSEAMVERYRQLYRRVIDAE